MNQRYAGDGPKGQTRKSAAKLKPKTEAAHSVHIDKKPTTKSERKAALKRREAEKQRKNQERAAKAAEREKAERIAAGEIVEPEKKPGIGGQLKKVFIGGSSSAKPGEAAASASGTPGATGKSGAASQSAGAAKPTSRPVNPNVPQTPEYKRLKRIYWVLMGIGIFFIVVSFLVQMYGYDYMAQNEFMTNYGFLLLMAPAYICLISGLILDYTKIRKLQRAHIRSSDSSKMSPKQIKHEQDKAEAARAMEESRQRQKEIKRAGSKIPLYRKKESSAKKDVQDSGRDAVDSEVVS
jgi:uncharacterized membrane protein